MILPGHLAVGYLAAETVLKLAPAGLLSTSQTAWLLTIGILASEGPDLDLLLYYFSERKHFRNQQTGQSPNKRRQSHRDYITHAPLFWVLVSAAISVIGIIFHSTFMSWSGLMVFVGSWSHLLMDSVEDGVLWLWPWHKRHLAVFYPTAPDWSGPRGGVGYCWYVIHKVYPRRLTFYLELFMTALALWVAFHP